MDVTFNSVPPISLQITLILALPLPRPKILERILSGICSLGIKKIYLINSWRVGKSYWQSPVLNKNNIYKQFILGLEQSKDTIVPELHLKKLFKPFVEDGLPDIIKNTKSI